jgi:hypothetical protein
MKAVDLNQNRSRSLEAHDVGAFLVGLLMVVGCGRGYRSVDMRGSVSVDGERANAGHITFLPVAAGMGRGGMALIAPDGSYHLRDVPLGEVTFTIVPEQKTGQQVRMTFPAGGTGLVDEVSPMLAGPAAFGRGQVTMQLQVTAESRLHDFALQATGTDGIPPR